jgi:hypothetical protein
VDEAALAANMEESEMRTTTLVVLAMVLIGAASSAWAADIAVTVKLREQITVALDKNSWGIPDIDLNGTANDTYLASVGNVARDLSITGTDGLNGWTIGAKGAVDVFEVDAVAAPDPAVVVPKTPTTASLASNIAKYGSRSFTLTYKAPATDDQGGDLSHDFTVTVTASKH